MLLPTTTKINIIKKPTSSDWINQALNNLEIILLDHSHCERKAAGVALNFLFRYPSYSELVRQLTAIAKEELEHFELVNQWLERLDIPLGPLKPSPYGAKLKDQISKQEPDRFLDSLLVAALIEARSHERLGLLAQFCPNRELANFYHSLMASEARHYGIYWLLAHHYFEKEPVNQRLEELAFIESEVLTNLYPEARIHS